LVLLCSGALPSPGQSSATQSPVVSTYRSQCAMCHGPDGRANTPMGKIIKVPAFQSQNLVSATDASLINSTTNGNGMMGAYGNSLSTAQIAQLVAYIRTLQQ